MPGTADAVVVGAGVIGCSVALELARGGRSVVVVDRGPGPGTGSTGASSAIVRFNYSTLTGVAVAWESRAAWEGWADHLGSPPAGLARFVRTGGLTLTAPGYDPSPVFAAFDEVGVPYEVWDAAAIRTRFPALDTGRYFPPKPVTDPAFFADAVDEVDGYWTPDAGFVDDPQRAAQDLADAARRHGATFRFRTTVVGVDRFGDRVAGVRLGGGDRVAAPVVVNAAGPWSHRLNELAGVLDDFAVDTRPLRQEVHAVTAPPGFGAPDRPGPFVADVDVGAYVRGTPGGGLLVGGMEPACDPLEWLADPDDANPNPTKAVHDAQVLRAARRMPELAVPDAPRGTAGVYDVTDDWIPVYDRTALPGYYVAIGTSGNQFKNAPVVGLLMAAVIAAGEEGRDAAPVPLPRTGRRVDLAHYSRRRRPHTGSSFSVLG